RNDDMLSIQVLVHRIPGNAFLCKPALTIVRFRPNEEPTHPVVARSRDQFGDLVQRQLGVRIRNPDPLSFEPSKPLRPLQIDNLTNRAIEVRITVRIAHYRSSVNLRTTSSSPHSSICAGTRRETVSTTLDGAPPLLTLAASTCACSADAFAR